MEAYKDLDGKSNRKVEAILVNHDTNQKAMDKYMTKGKVNFPGLQRAESEKNLLTSISNLKALPTMVIADANGKVIMRAEGVDDCEKAIAKMKSLAK